MKVTKFDTILNIWVSLIISLVLSYALPMITNGSITTGEYFSGLIISFVISFILVMLIPIVKLGDMFAAECGTKPNTIARQLLSTIVLVLIMGTVMSLIMTWWGLHNISDYTSFFFTSWLHAYPWVLFIIYITSNISLWTGIPLTKRILGISSGEPLDY